MKNGLRRKMVSNDDHGDARFKQRGARYVGGLAPFLFLVSAEVQALGASSSASADNKPSVLAARRFPDASAARRSLKVRRVPFWALMCLQCHGQADKSNTVQSGQNATSGINNSQRDQLIIQLPVCDVRQRRRDDVMVSWPAAGEKAGCPKFDTSSALTCETRTLRTCSQYLNPVFLWSGKKVFPH